MERKLVDLWVGLFGILGIAALVILALKAGNLASFALDKSYQVTAKFDNVGGLKPRAPVKSAGVVVGRVVGITLDKESYQAVVTLKIDAHYPFPQDTIAKILTSGLLGEQYLGLEPGADTVALKDKSRIKDTQSAVVLENLISQVMFSKAAEGKIDGNK